MRIKHSYSNRLTKTCLAALLMVNVGNANALLADWDGSLPTAGDPLTSQQYQDFTVYSLNYLTNLAEHNQDAGDPYNGSLTIQDYNVQSSPGSLHDELVVITGNTGQVDNNQDVCDPNSCDDAYAYPSSSYTFMTTGTTPESGPVVTGLTVGETSGSSWSATQDALASFLGDGNLTFMFNLNEDNGGDVNTLDGQSLLMFAKVDLVADDGITVIGSFYLGGNNALFGAGASEAAYLALGEPEADATNTGLGNEAEGSEGNELYDPLLLDLGLNGYISQDPRWAYIHGAISVDTDTGAFLGFGDCTYTLSINPLLNCTTVNQNLGANEVAFAAINLELSQAIKSGMYMGQDVGFMNVDVVIAGQSNGFEQLFITATGGSDICCEVVPEPDTLAIFSLGLLLLGFYAPTSRTRNFLT